MSHRRLLAILVVIVGEVWPLFRPPWAERLTQEASGAPPAAGEAIGVDEIGLRRPTLDDAFFALADGEAPSRHIEEVAA